MCCGGAIHTRSVKAAAVKPLVVKPPPVSVPRLFPGSTIVCIASGPSLTAEDVHYCRGKAPIVAVNTSYRLAPDCAVIWGSDAKWWAWHKGVPEFSGLRYCLEKPAMKWGVQILRNTGHAGLEESPTGVKNGRNSGYAALNCAVHLGASRIVLLGYDCKRGPNGEEHWHPDHPHKIRSPYDSFRRYFDTMVEPLKKRNVSVVNCSRDTALQAFLRMPLEEALR